MKNTTIFFGVGLLLLNTLFGLVLSIYSQFNWIAADLVILANTIILYFISCSDIKDGFKISFYFIFPFLAFIQYVMAVNMKNTFENNIMILVIAGMFIIQLFLFILGRAVSTND